MCEVLVEEVRLVCVVWMWFVVCCCYGVCCLKIGCWREEGVHLVGGGRVGL